MQEEVEKGSHTRKIDRFFDTLGFAGWFWIGSSVRPPWSNTKWKSYG